MGSSKGQPTDPELREKVVESKSSRRHDCDHEAVALPCVSLSCCAEVKNKTNKDGSGKGQMAAWKGGKNPVSVTCQPGRDSIVTPKFCLRHSRDSKGV